MPKSVAFVTSVLGRLALALMASLQLLVSAAPVHAQSDDDHEEPSFSVNGMLRMQGGVFAPLASSKFRPHENIAAVPTTGAPCDVRMGNSNCVPSDHGQRPGSVSLARTTLQIESHWDINDRMALHAIVRGVRSLRLPGDAYARPPQQNLEAWRNADYDGMGRTAQDWAAENLYSELDLREFYLDLFPTDWLSMRIGRQQVMWGDVGGYRLLDAVNPENSTWHFGPLESVEDIRIPLWMWLTTIDMPKIEHSLELLWIPMIDRKKDTVTTPLSFAGAWGVPFSNTPTSFFSPNMNFKYPGRDVKDMRAGFRWKGSLGTQMNYSLVYLFTHQFSPPVPTDGFYGQVTRQMADPMTGRITEASSPDSAITREINLEFPRQHIAGFSIEQNLPFISSVARLEAAFEPNRTFSGRTDRPQQDPNNPYRMIFHREQMMAVNYAFVLQRPTMIRFLNPTQNFLLVGQFFHSFLPTLDMESAAGRQLVHLVGFNQWQLQRHSLRVAGIARTSYLNGRITVAATGVYMPNPYAKDSGFYSVDVGVRLGTHYRLNVVVTDFVGKDPYRDMGLFRDRDELAASLTVLF